MASLAEIRAKLKQAEQRGSGERTGGGDNSIYPFWNLKEGEEATLRFLPDGNQDNTFFWVERAMIKLPFAGVKGETDNKQTIVQVETSQFIHSGISKKAASPHFVFYQTVIKTTLFSGLNVQ